jgi:hypothetical protein
MQNGRVRKVSIIYPITKTNAISKVKFRMDSNSEEEQQTRALAIQKVEYQPPKILCQRLISKDNSINKQKKYSAMNIYS